MCISSSGFLDYLQDSVVEWAGDLLGQVLSSHRPALTITPQCVEWVLEYELDYHYVSATVQASSAHTALLA